MSTTAEDISSTLSSARPGESSDDQAETIAELLVGDAESEDKDDEDEATQTQASTDSEDEESNEESEADDGEEETTLETVEDGDVTWEGALGVSEGDLSFDEEGNVNGFNTKVNGESEVVDAKTLLAGYQNNKSFTQKSQAHAENVKEFEIQKGQTEQLYASKLESVDALTKHFEKQLISEYDGVNWDQLRAEDPAEYAAARHDYAAKAGELQSIMTAIATDKETFSKEAMESQQAANSKYMKNQYDLMIERNPEWSDEKVRNEAQDGFKSFVKEQYGFGDQEWGMVNDARLIELIKDAKKYHDGAKVAERKTNKPVPKFQKSRGERQKPKTSKLEKLTAASRKAGGSEKRELQQSAVAELLLGG